MEQNQHTYRNVRLETEVSAASQGSRRCLACLFPACWALITTTSTDEPQQGRQAGERPHLTEGTPNPFIVTDYKSISHSCRKEEKIQEQPQTSLRNGPSFYCFTFKQGFKLQDLEPGSGGLGLNFPPSPGRVWIEGLGLCLSMREGLAADFESEFNPSQTYAGMLRPISICLG